eukprot:CAMPEP_0174987854 /NCGR_PEP_ID=MMETSP0004_2-20121128/19788_1 /TAXON_ID=420556 /ORGANISM="Ochromonas sp., Strain CCMP1393" /LENGTH=205 /DNA_ID=CAMNT_0016240979 /DNA_START=5 /DNA_END=623 /DNA_ORIENTATION=+
MIRRLGAFKSTTLASIDCICRNQSIRNVALPAAALKYRLTTTAQLRGYRSTAIYSETKITENSWAADRLEELGEKLEPEELPMTRLTEEALYEPSEKTAKLAEEVLALNLLEINQFMKIIERRLGLPEGFMNQRKDAFDIKLVEVDAKSKIKIIKEVRAITGLGLKEAKEMVENAPVVVKQGLKKDEAESLLKALTDVGAKAELL